MLKVENLSVSYFGTKIIEDVSFEVTVGDWLMIVGPNGAGKTTVTNAISQSAPYKGDIIYKNRNIKNMKTMEKAREIGVLMQHHNVAYSYSVGEIVSLGRYSHSKNIFGKTDNHDETIIEDALIKTGMVERKNQSVLTLSGGELQRTFLAQLLTQNPSLMILDEPTNHLDMAYQEQVFELVKNWLAEGERAVISVVHDLRLARLFGSKALILKDGKVFKYGLIEDVMDRETLQSAYSFDVYNWLNKLNSKWS